MRFKKSDFAYYAVVGGGEFPVDMLRYDSSFPAIESQANRLMASWEPGLRYVILGTVCRETNLPRCTPARWNSFGWQVVRFSVPGDNRVGEVAWFGAAVAADQTMESLDLPTVVEHEKRSRWGT